MAWAFHRREGPGVFGADGTGEIGLPDESVIAGSTRALDLMLDYAKG